MTPEESLHLEIKLRDDRWEELKMWIEEGRGGNFRTVDILRKMRELEEK